MTIKNVLKFERNILNIIAGSKPACSKGYKPMIVAFFHKTIDPRQAGEPLTIVYAMHKTVKFEFINQ